MTFWKEVEKQALAQQPAGELQDLVGSLQATGDFADMAPGRTRIERPMQTGMLFSPGRVDLDGDRLIWNPLGGRYKRAKEKMLVGFILLCDADDFPAAVLSFAKTWGVLGVCKHNLPCSHNPGSFGSSHGAPPCLPMLVTPLAPDVSGFMFWEPLSAWWAWSRKMKSLLAIASRLKQHQKASSEDWDVVKDTRDSGIGDSASEPYVRSIPAARAELARELDDWISIGQVRPRISWSISGWRFNLDAASMGPNLFGLLALYVATEVAGMGFASCSECGKSYRPERQLNPKTRNYCLECRGGIGGKKAAWREASRRYRRLQGEKRATLFSNSVIQ